MALRKVLLLTYHFPPSAAVAVYRMLGLARHLPKYGWQPVVVAPPSVPWEPQDPALLEKVPPGTPIERVPFATGFVGDLARWVAPEMHWICKARSACRRMIETHRPEAILTSSPPGCIHRLGMWLQAQYKLPWLACFRDPWIVNARVSPWTVARFYEGTLEPRVMDRATTIIANTPLNQEGWTKAYPGAAHKMVTITNGFDPENFTSTAEPVRDAEVLSMLHAGEFYDGRDPRPFLDALGGEKLPVNVELLGRKTDGAFDLSGEIACRGLGGQVVWTNQVPYAEAIDRMKRSHILLLVHTPGRAIGVPAKLYEYLGAGRPILALAEPDGDIAWVLRESKVLHRIVAPMDVAGIRKAIAELTQAVRAAEPVVPDQAALQRFTREQMARRVAECLDRSQAGVSG